MKIAFSTLGCPDWRWNEIYSTARDLGFDGIEVRGIANEIRVPKIHAFNEDNLEKNKKLLADADLEIPMLTSGISLGMDYDRPLEEAKEYIELASKLSTPYIRVMITNHPQPEQADLSRAKALYAEICALAAPYGVTPLIETNGVLADSAAMEAFIRDIDAENKGVLWDIHHPFRFFGEEPHETFRNIGRYVRYVHVKDSIVHGENITYRMMGYGDLPIFDALKVLKENHYDGYVSLEWVKRWNPDLEEPGIVFAHFKSYISFLLERL